jgi:hypothetical protein
MADNTSISMKSDLCQPNVDVYLNKVWYKNSTIKLNDDRLSLLLLVADTTNKDVHLEQRQINIVKAHMHDGLGISIKGILLAVKPHDL